MVMIYKSNQYAILQKSIEDQKFKRTCAQLKHREQSNPNAGLFPPSIMYRNILNYKKTESNIRNAFLLHTIDVSPLHDRAHLLNY